MKRIWNYPTFWCVVLTLVGFASGMSVDHQIKKLIYGNPNHVVVGGSMEKTMFDGDLLEVVPIPDDFVLRRDDIVCFRWDSDKSVKRVSLLPGDIDKFGAVVQPGFYVLEGDNKLTKNPPPVRREDISGLVVGIRYNRQQLPIQGTIIQSYSNDGRVAEIRNGLVTVNGSFLASHDEVANANGGSLLQWSGIRLFWASNHRIFVWNGRNIQIVYDGDGFELSPDGKYVAVVQQTGLAIVKLDTHSLITFVRQGGFPKWDDTLLHYKLEYMEPGNWVPKKLDIMSLAGS